MASVRRARHLRQTSALLAVMLCSAALAAAPARASSYSGVMAAQWAYDNLDEPYLFPDDCTHFVSQALWAGGLSPTAQWTYDSTDRDILASTHLFGSGSPTKDAADANDFYHYMVDSGTAVSRPITWSDNTASGAAIGDVIAYHWNAGEPADVIDHVALVTDLNDHGYPSVTQHSDTQRNRYWSYSESAHDWIELANPGSHAYLLHIVK